MNRLEDALKRLEQAVARLEAVAGRRAESDGSDVAALAAVRSEYAALVDTTTSVAARLDAAIGRLDRMLEG